MKKISALLMVFLLSVAAQAVIVDDFSDTGLAEYTLTVVNDGSTTRAVSFASPSGDLWVAKATDTGHEQVLFLRDDYTLDVGELLIADVIQSGTGWDRDLGIAVGWTKTPPGVPDGGTGDVRTNYVEVSFRSNNQVMTYARDGTTNLPSGQVFPSPISIVEALYIERTGVRDFDLGYLTAGVKTSVKSYTITTDPVLGAAIGFYADVRAAIGQSPVGLDNLRIIPEPATMVLLGIGSVLALRRRK